MHIYAGLRQESVARETDHHLANPIIPDDILKGEELVTMVTTCVLSAWKTSKVL